MTEELLVLRTNDEISALTSHLQESARSYIAFDTETTGLALDAQVIGFSVATETHRGYYVVLAEWIRDPVESPAAGVLQWLDNKAKALELLQFLSTQQLVMHNAVVDINWTKVNFGVDLMPALHTDTMLLAHLLDENRRVGLKDLANSIFGEGATTEQAEMKASVIANGGEWDDTRGGNKEMYKASSDLMGRYGAKDTVLTLRLFDYLSVDLCNQKLEKFFYEDETMPLLKAATYDMNTVGLKLDVEAIKKLQLELELDIADLEHSIKQDLLPLIKDEFPKGFGKKTGQFNLGSRQQMAWLLHIKLGEDWKKLTDGGREVAKDLCGRIPYSYNERVKFRHAVEQSLDAKGKPLKFISLIKCDKTALEALSPKYAWLKQLLEHSRLSKLLSTYVLGLQERSPYGVVNPSFLQHGTTSGRYSSRNPNFQNLPRDDTRVKQCIVARPGRVFVGADFSQLEARVFAFMSGEPSLIESFSKGEDLYSLIGINIFEKFDCLPLKEGNPLAFGVKHKALRQNAKNSVLAVTYGTTAFRLSEILKDESRRHLSPDECQTIINNLFASYPKLKAFQKTMHWKAIHGGVVTSYFGRKRRIPSAQFIKQLMTEEDDASELPYEYRTPLNLAVNHTIQSTAASIVNRAAIAFHRGAISAGLVAPIVLQVHDELVAETPVESAEAVRVLLKHSMETTTVFPGMSFPAEPKIARNLAELK